MCEAVFKQTDEQFLKANFDKENLSFTITTNKNKLSFFQKIKAFYSQSQHHSGWVFESNNRDLKSYSPYQAYSLYLLQQPDHIRDAKIFLKKNTSAYSKDIQLHLNFAIQSLFISSSHDDDHFFIYKSTNKNSPCQVESMNIMSGSGGDHFKKEMSHHPECKKRYDQFRFNFFGQAGNDTFHIETFGINFLSGGLGNDYYDLNIAISKEYSHPNLKKFFTNTSFVSIGLVGYYNEQTMLLKSAFNGKKPESIIGKKGMTFISDNGSEQNNITINMDTEKKNGFHTHLPTIYIASSDQLHPAIAKRLSPDPFLILKISNNFVFLHPEVTSHILFDYKSFHKKTLYMSSQNDSKPRKNQLHKLHSFNSLPKEFNFRKLRTQLNGMVYTPITSLESIDDNNFYLGDLMKKN